jgi:hypothetical protein
MGFPGGGHKLKETSAERQENLLFYARVAMLGTMCAGIIALAVSVLGFTTPVRALSVSNADELRDVFFSGQPWLVFCKDSHGKMEFLFRFLIER